jgi:zinc transporter 5/7
LTGALIPLPFLFASLAYPPEHLDTAGKRVVFGPRKPSFDLFQNEKPSDAALSKRPDTALLEACIFSAAALLLVGILARIQSSQTLDRRKGLSDRTGGERLLRPENISRVLSRILGVGLPYYASTHIGGVRTALVLLLVISSGLTGWATASNGKFTWQGTISAIRERKLTCAVVLLCGLFDVAGMTEASTRVNMFLGYTALFMSAFALPIPAATLGPQIFSRPPGASTSPRTPSATLRRDISFESLLISSIEESNLTILAGAVLATLTITSSLLLSTAPGLSITATCFTMASISSFSGLVFFAKPLQLISANKLGYAAGLALTAVFGIFYDFESWTTPIVSAALCSLAYFAVLFDISASPSSRHEHHEQEHGHQHAHGHASAKHSFLTAYILTFVTPGSIVDSIMRERDSRRIAYFGW